MGKELIYDSKNISLWYYDDTKIIKKYFNKNLIVIKNPKNALKYAKKIASKKDLVLVTGSIFLVGELI